MPRRHRPDRRRRPVGRVAGGEYPVGGSLKRRRVNLVQLIGGDLHAVFGLHRKLGNLVRKIKEEEGIEKDRIVVQLSSCMTKDNYHAVPCPNLDYIKALIAKVGIDFREDTVISETSEKRREEGLYRR